MCSGKCVLMFVLVCGIVAHTLQEIQICGQDEGIIDNNIVGSFIYHVITFTNIGQQGHAQESKNLTSKIEL